MAQVKFKRIESSTDINNIPIIDGQITYTKDGKTYLDYETERVVVNGTPETVISGTSTNAVANSTVKNYVDSSIETVSNMIHNGTILWTNNNPTSSFATQTITLSSDNYDMLLIIYKTDLTIYNAHSEIIIKGYGGQLDFFSTAVENRRWARRFAWVSDTQIEFQDAWYFDGNSSTKQNDSLIPLYVVGYNTGLF